MTKDYKHLGEETHYWNTSSHKDLHSRRKKFNFGSYLYGFISGAALVIAGGLIYGNSRTQVETHISDSNQPQDQAPTQVNQTAAEEKTLAPTFEFYQVLPSRNPISTETIATFVEVEDNEEETPSSTEIEASKEVADAEAVHLPDIKLTQQFLLQVGSFQDPKTADRVKAILAILGIDSHIYTTGEGEGENSTKRYNIHIGPYPNKETLKPIQTTLTENDFNFLILERPSTQLKN